MADYSPDLINALKKFYEALDDQIRQIESKNPGRINCKRGCFSCCRDDLEVFGVEAAYIRNNNQETIQSITPHPKGACAFLDNEGSCRIYSSRPFVCRTHGVPISFLEEENEQVFEYLNICPLNEEGEPLETLPTDAVFAGNEWEEKLALLQLMADKGTLERAKLRAILSDSET